MLKRKNIDIIVSEINEKEKKMAKAKGKHVSDKAQYAGYAQQLKRIKNRKAKLARHMKKFPNDTQAVAASKTDGTQREKSMVKGHFPAEQYVLRNAAGHIIVMSTFEPQGKRNV